MNYTNKVPTQKIIIFKTDASGETALPGAKFDLYQQAGWLASPKEAIKTGFVSNEFGLIDLGYLPVGVWVLKETEAPFGYQVLPMPVTVNIQETGVTYDDGTDFSRSGEGVNHLSTGEYVLTVINKPRYMLPATGGPGTAALTRFGAALSLLGLALLYLRGRQERGTPAVCAASPVMPGRAAMDGWNGEPRPAFAHAPPGRGRRRRPAP